MEVLQNFLLVFHLFHVSQNSLHLSKNPFHTNQTFILVSQTSLRPHLAFLRHLPDPILDTCLRPLSSCPRPHPVHFRPHSTWPRLLPHSSDLILLVPVSSHISQTFLLAIQILLVSRPFPMFETLYQSSPTLLNAVHSPSPSLTPVSSLCSLTLP